METFISRKRNKLFSGRIGGGNITAGYTVRIRGLFAAIHECIQLVGAYIQNKHEQRQTHPLADALPNRQIIVSSAHRQDSSDKYLFLSELKDDRYFGRLILAYHRYFGISVFVA